MMLSLEAILYSGAVGLLAIGAVGLVACTNLFRMVLALAIAEAGANLLLVMAGFRWDAAAPIILGGSGQMVDPVPQAMVLTAIVIGVGIQALAVAIILRVERTYGTLEMSELRHRMELELAAAAGIPSLGSQDAPAGERPLPAAVQVREGQP